MKKTKKRSAASILRSIRQRADTDEILCSCGNYYRSDPFYKSETPCDLGHQKKK